MMKYDHPTRRDFLRQALFAACAAASPSLWALPGDSVPTRVLGRTGEKVSMLGLGGHHLGRIRDDQESIRLIRRAIDMRVTFMDNAWEYHRGRSEELMGRALRDGYRKKVFLMTKHHGRRDKKVAMKHLEDSLRRLQTDVIDLWQFHEVVYEDDPEMIFSKAGAIEAAEAAKKAGKVKYIGFTGHKDPEIHLKMLKHDYEWDAVQMPLNALDPHYKSFQKKVLPLLLKRNIGVIAMKTMASGYLLRTGVVTPDEALRYVWSLPVSTIVSGVDSVKMLISNVKVARDFKPMTEEAKNKLLEKTREAAQTGEYEPFKSTNMFDGPIGRQIHGIR